MNHEESLSQPHGIGKNVTEGERDWSWIHSSSDALTIKTASDSCPYTKVAILNEQQQLASCHFRVNADSV